jgi:hypothetical protein
MPRKKTSKRISSRVTARIKHDELPATVGLVKEVRSELIAEIRSVENGLGGKIEGLAGKVGGLEGKIGELAGNMQEMEGRLASRIDQVVGGLHRTQALMEEQRGENKIVLDGIKSVMERQDRAEEEAKEFRRTLQLLMKPKDLTTTQ